MSFHDRLRAAWACEECRLYRRAALALALLGVVSWMLL
jgi:hypothetical protein